FSSFQFFKEGFLDVGRNEVGNFAAELGDFFYQRGTEKRELRRWRHENGRYVGSEIVVHHGHLELKFEIADSAQTAKDDCRANGAGEFHCQAGEGESLHIWKRCD